MRTYNWTKTGLTVKRTNGEVLLYTGSIVEKYRGAKDLAEKVINDYGVTLLEYIEHHESKPRLVRHGY